ncbi:hypothetical protein AOLI_G00149620 [Acnodon oligacanthus]
MFCGKLYTVLTGQMFEKRNMFLPHHSPLKDGWSNTSKQGQVRSVVICERKRKSSEDSARHNRKVNCQVKTEKLK